MSSTIVDASGINDSDRLMSLDLLKSAINRLAGISMLKWKPVRGRQLKGLKRATLPGGIWYRGKIRETYLELQGDDLSLFIQWDGVLGMDLPFAIGGRARFYLADGSRVNLLMKAMQGWADILQKSEVWIDVEDIGAEMQVLSGIARGLIASSDDYSWLEIRPSCYGEHTVMTYGNSNQPGKPWSVFDRVTGLSNEFLISLDKIVKDRIFITDDIVKSRRPSELPFISVGSPPDVSAGCITDPVARMRAIAELPLGVKLLTPQP